MGPTSTKPPDNFEPEINEKKKWGRKKRTVGIGPFYHTLGSEQVDLQCRGPMWTVGPGT